MNETQLLRDTLEVWCPNYPRRVSGVANNGRGWGQRSVDTQSQTIDSLKSIKYVDPGFVSVYSFPRGHTSDEGDAIPHIDTLMFDLDLDGSPDDSTEKWERDMSALLTRTRMIAKALLDMDKARFWRASLSGHKGIHLYLDFPAIDTENGTPGQFREGMRNYTEGVIDALIEETKLNDLDEYVDVSSGKDFARLTRLPNTVHETATRRFGELRYCVPVTIEELAEIYPEEYVRLTSDQRKISENMKRQENERAAKILSKEIRLSSPSRNWNNGRRRKVDIGEYQENVNDDITLQVLRIQMRPCFWKLREREDMFDHGMASHKMEVACIAEMMAYNTPLDVMVEFFNTADNFNEGYTKAKIEDVINHDYDKFNCSTIIEDSEIFCLKDDCGIYNKSDDLQKLSS